MRINRWLTTVALALTPVIASAQSSTTPATPADASAQQQPVIASPDTPASEYVPAQRNIIDFGVRGSSVTGDSARYERFRDMGDGLFLEGFALNRQTKNGWFLDAAGRHIGRLDQSYDGSIVRPGKVKALFSWDQIPMLQSNSTSTVFTNPSGSVLTIDDSLQSLAQTSSAALGANYKSFSQGFDLKSRRYIGQGSIEVMPNSDFTLKADVKRMDRTGSMPFGGSFGHSNFVETVAPVNQQLTNVDGGAEFLHGPVLLRAGYNGSFFNNDNSTLTFDNPWRLTDIAGTSGRGRTSLPPSNSFYSVNGLASFRMARHTRATAYLSTGFLKDASGTPILDQTINSANLPALTPLPRTTVDGEARTTSANLKFSSSPFKYVDVKAEYRRYNYDNRTPLFVMPQRVAYDATPAAATYSTLGGLTATEANGVVVPVETEPFGLTRESFDAEFGVTPVTGTSARFGYSRIAEDRSHRFFENTTENILRVTFDQVANNWFSVRTKFEHGEKRGDVTEEAQLELWNIGEQPGTRHFDIASRDRNRGTIAGIVNLGANASVNASFAAGKDDYIESQFGLRDNTNRVYGAGFDFTPTEKMNFGLEYAFERYTALSRSRTANPPSGSATITYEQYLALVGQPSTTVQVADASRNWADDSADRVHTLVATADFLRIADKVDVRLSVDLSRSSTKIDYLLGPVSILPGEPSAPTSIQTPTFPAPLPTNRSDFGRSTVDALYSLTEHIGIGVSYWYEQYRVQDFSLDAAATPSLAFGPTSSALLTGYIYRPYTANTVWGRMVYRW